MREEEERRFIFRNRKLGFELSWYFVCETAQEIYVAIYTRVSLILY
jgi:hypothetical protein